MADVVVGVTIDQSGQDVLCLFQLDCLFWLVLFWINANCDKRSVQDCDPCVRFELTRFCAKNVAAGNKCVDGLLRFDKRRKSNQKQKCQIGFHRNDSHLNAGDFVSDSD